MKTTRILLTILSAVIIGNAQDFVQAGLDDYKPYFRDKENFNETWSYQIALDNGTQIYLDLSRLNEGSNKYTTANLFFVNFYKSNKHVTSQYPADKYFKYDKTGENFTLTFHSRIYVEGNNTSQKIRFYREKNNTRYFLELDISEMAAGFKLKNEIKKLENDNYTGYIIHFPTAAISGKIAVNNDTMSVSGQGMMDHIYQSDLPTEIFQKGIRYFKPGADIESGLIFMGNTSNKHKMVGIGISGARNALAAHTPVSVDKHMSKLIFSDNHLVQFSGFRKLDQWGVLDEAPKGLGFLAKVLKKDLIHKRGVGTAPDGASYVITKFYVK